MMNKSESKKKMSKIIIAVGAIVMLAMGYTINEMANRLFNDDRKIEIEPSEECKEKNLYYEANGFDIYTYCIDSIKIFGENEQTELKNLFETDLTLENLFGKMKEKEIYKDGGSIMYTDIENGIAILKCNTLEGNRDIYIGKSDMKYESDFCKNNKNEIQDKEFSQNLEVLLITDSLDKAYKYLTLRHIGKDEIKTVKVKVSDINDLKKKGTYTFKFQTDKIPFKDEIETVFANSKIIDITKFDN